MKVSIELYCMSEDGIFASGVYSVKDGLFDIAEDYANKRFQD